MQSNMSVLGLYQYDEDIFGNMHYPNGFTTNDKDDFVYNLLMEVAELEVIYPNPSFMKSAITLWSRKECPTWNRIYAAAQLEYNPIENYDRQEETTDSTEASKQHSGTDTTTNTGTDTRTNSGKDTTQFTGTDTITNTGTDTTTNSGSDVVSNTGTDTVTNSGKDTTQLSGSDSLTNSGSDVTTMGGQDTSSSSGSKSVTNSGTDTTTNKIAAFNSSTLVDHDTSALAHGHATSETTSDSVTVTHGQTETLAHGHVETTQHGKKEELTHGHVEALQHGHTEALQHGLTIEDESETTRTSRIHGNIGVTTSQQMLEQELEVAPKLNIINIMIDSFKNRFCILVY